MSLSRFSRKLLRSRFSAWRSWLELVSSSCTAKIITNIQTYSVYVGEHEWLVVSVWEWILARERETQRKRERERERERKRERERERKRKRERGVQYRSVCVYVCVYWSIVPICLADIQFRWSVWTQCTVLKFLPGKMIGRTMAGHPAGQLDKTQLINKPLWYL